MFETILMIIFALLFFFISWWKIDWAIVLCLVFSPAYLIRFELFSIPMTVLEIMILVIFLVWIIKVFIPRSRGTETASVGEKWRERCKRIWWPWKWLILIFVLVGIVAVLISPDIRQALGLWKAYILEPVIFFVVFVNVIKTKQQVRAIIWALGSLVVVVGYITLLQYINILEIPAHYGFEIPKRATSFFPFPTAVGKLVGPLVALFLGMLITKESFKITSLFEFVKKNIFTIGILLFGLMGLMFSVSRGAVLGIFIALIFASFFSKWKKWIWGVLGVLIILALLITPIRNNVMDVFSAQDVSTDVRLVMWKGAVRIIQDNPITGTGLASFPVVYEDYKEASHTEYFPNPDHFILSVWIEMGLAGLIIFGWIFIRFFKYCQELFYQNKQLSVGLMSAMVALLAYGFLDTPYFKNDLAIIFWVLVGLVVVLRKQNQETA
ncbi:MAG: O-antigen ligase family protein [bacterium]|nr:O-antigen ligase family protein [bacterium]